MKRNFSRVLAGALIFTTIAIPISSVYGNTTVTQSYENSIESITYQVNETIKEIQGMIKEGTLNQDILRDLSHQIYNLEKAVTSSGKSASAEVVEAILKAEAVVANLEGAGANAAKVAIMIVKGKLDIKADTKVQTETQNQNTVKKVNLSDISTHWGKDTIQFLVGRGAINGYPDGTFKPNNSITRAEFLSIALRSARNGQMSATTDDHWATGLFKDAETLGVLKPGEMPRSSWNQPINRYEMTMVMTRILEEVSKENPVGTNGAANLISDYQAVSNQPAYKYYVEQAFMKGLITGKGGGLFDGGAVGTRAEASVMVSRIIDKNRRAAVDTSKIVQGTAQTLRWNDADRPNPKLGDTFIKPDGTKVVLQVGPSGVLGEGQGVSLFEGMVNPDGSHIKHGSLGTRATGYHGQTYLVDQRTGSGHFWLDWTKIEQRELKEALEIKNPKENQMVGNFTKYVKTSNGSFDWVWLGPANN